MCFSATASFTAAALTGAIGILALSKVREPRELPLAATPLFFALQQSIEGLQWLTLPVAPDGPISTGLTFFYLIFAEVFWPIYGPLALLLIEPNQRRRQLMLLCLVAGISVGAYLLWFILKGPYGATISDGHIVYATEYVHSDAIPLAYLAATSLPLFLSSQRMMSALGVIILVGSAVAYILYREAFVSVWCLFAAVASVVILRHVEWSRRQRLRIAAA